MEGVTDTIEHETSPMTQTEQHRAIGVLLVDDDRQVRAVLARVLWYEVLGFGLIVALSWANELFSLPALIFGVPHQPNWRESASETLIVALVAIPVIALTGRLVRRLRHLEEFLRVCAWCRKV